LEDEGVADAAIIGVGFGGKEGRFGASEAVGDGVAGGAAEAIWGFAAFCFEAVEATGGLAARVGGGVDVAHMTSGTSILYFRKIFK
jgi:hypothetical protein